VSGESIQEIGGDLIYLAPDGFRTIAGTTRIGDVELSSVSRGIQPLLEDVTSDVSTYVVSSTVIRDKSQYRFFYSVDGGTATAAKGVIGTLGAEGFQWSELQGIAVAAITSDFDSAGEEVYYHGTEDGYIHLHDIGNSFNGSNILAKYRTSNLDFGDLGTLKTLKYVKISITPEGTVQPHLRVRFDYDSSDVAQPDDIVLDSIPAASVFGTAIFGVDIFGAVSDPIIRQTLEGSGHTSSYEIFSDDTRAPYTVNGMYINYDPSGRY
jgi:hypothetical protein